MKSHRIFEPRALLLVGIVTCAGLLVEQSETVFAKPQKQSPTLGSLESVRQPAGKTQPRLPLIQTADRKLTEPKNLPSNTPEVVSNQPTRPKVLPVVSKSATPIDLTVEGDSDVITIATKSIKSPYKVQRLTKPDRLVIDIQNERLPKSSEIRKGTKLLSGIRIGNHSDKARIVLDLKNSSIRHKITRENGVLRVALSPERVKVVAKTEEKKEPVKGQIKRSRTALQLDEAILVSGDSKGRIKPPTIRTMPKLISSKANGKPNGNTKPKVNTKKSIHPLALPAALEETKSSGAVIANEKETILSRIALKGQEGTSPRIALTIPKSVRHTLTRTAPSEYVATLFDVRPSADLVKQTIFSSSKSTAIRSVRAAKNGQDTLVRIFTQPTSYLTSRRDGDSLIIEESHDLSKIAKDIRAQISPAAANQKGKDDSSKNIKKAVSNKPTKGQVDLKKRLKSQKKEVKPRVTKNDSTSELAAIRGDSATYTGRLISLDLQDADIDSALRIIAEVSNLNIVAGDGVSGKVTLKLVDVPWDQALEVILKSHGLDKVLQGNVLRVAPVDKLKAERESFKEARVAEEELEPLSVKYMRVSYAKASEITALVETVLTERGTVAFDERSNQLVVKDVAKGLKNVSELVKKIDLRTPQILLETQIVEASRSLSRELGSELGFQYIQSPATGNGTGLNFPSAVSVGGSADPTGGGITGSAFPIASSATLGSAITMLFDSADGTKSLSARLSQLEQEGEVRIISKPAVATTNNKPAEIKSVEKFRVKLPNGGLSIATGSGAQSAGSGDSATQTIEAGIVLNVTPQASPDYYILLDIKAKSSSFGAKAVDGIPNEIERSASSSVLVSSGQTFALGGIYKITEQDRVAGVPFFKDIPVLGTFFRSLTTENSDEELLFFITPRIVEGSFEDASMKMVS